MTNLVETDEFTPNIYQLEIADAPEGGLFGIDNVQPRQLANRTLWLKNRLAEHAAAADPHPQYMTAAESDAVIAAAVAALVASSPAALDTLNELAAALGNDPNFAATINAAIAARLTQAQGDVRYAKISSSRTVGELFFHLGNTAPAGSMAAPVAATSLSRAVYPDLHTFCADLGYPWGAGDGATTFGMPYVPPDYALVQANGNVRSMTVGELIAHLHGGIPLITSPTMTYSGGSTPYPTGGYGNSNSTGGAANKAAGVRVLICVQYQP